MEEKLAVIFLALGACFAIWSAFMPSVFTIAHFGLGIGLPPEEQPTEEDKRTLLISGAVASFFIALSVIAVWVVFWRKTE